MCRNMKPLFNYEPDATEAAMRASALQYVRKISGYTKPSRANQEAFDRAVENITAATRELLHSLVTDAPPRDRETEIARLAVLGISTRDIAERLDVKQGTVKIHLHSIYEMLNVGGRLGLVLFARRHGLA